MIKRLARTLAIAAAALGVGFGGATALAGFGPNSIQPPLMKNVTNYACPAGYTNLGWYASYASTTFAGGGVTVLIEDVPQWQICHDGLSGRDYVFVINVMDAWDTTHQQWAYLDTMINNTYIKDSWGNVIATPSKQCNYFYYCQLNWQGYVPLRDGFSGSNTLSGWYDNDSTPPPVYFETWLWAQAGH